MYTISECAIAILVKEVNEMIVSDDGLFAALKGHLFARKSSVTVLLQFGEFVDQKTTKNSRFTRKVRWRHS